MFCAGTYLYAVCASPLTRITTASPCSVVSILILLFFTHVLVVGVPGLVTSVSYFTEAISAVRARTSANVWLGAGVGVGVGVSVGVGTGAGAGTGVGSGLDLL